MAMSRLTATAEAVEVGLIYCNFDRSYTPARSAYSWECTSGLQFSAPLPATLHIRQLWFSVLWQLSLAEVFVALSMTLPMIPKGALLLGLSQVL